ncbi:MAG TPA: oligosaccharide flippase family protein [Polyangia bacterium]|nr:oligosaccharide flippase family protein [Polyangia bacterium]
MTSPAVEVPAPTRAGLRGRMLRGSIYEIAGYGTQQVLRLGSNLILTRILFPAAFGTASIVTVILVGLVMLSDVAVQSCLIQSRRGDEPAFRNTAFSLQAIRGVVIALFMVLLAKPAAWFYKQPELEHLVQFGALQLVFNGLHSTAIATLRRKVRLGWVNGLDLLQTAVGLPITFLLARTYPGPWALVAGMVISSGLYTIATHFLPVGYRNRFQWDKTAVAEISQFGRWVFGSSAAGFLGSQADRILMGRFLGAAWLGVYSVALNLSDAVGSVVGRVVSGVMFPVLSEAARGETADGHIGGLYDGVRRRLDVMSMGMTGFLTGFGAWIVHLLWDERYADAGWILQVLAVRVAITALISPGETCLFALGHTRYGFQRSVVRLCAAAILVPAGWYLGGVPGVIWGAVATEAATVFAVWPAAHRHGILRLRRELTAVAIFLAAFALGRLLRGALPALVIHRGHHAG